MWSRVVVLVMLATRVALKVIAMLVMFEVLVKLGMLVMLVIS